ncbi:MAG TPA: TatD family hydrolase [Oligoflexia bacterium]|nr:TatD family hydrolase [Oligoflexia bacterium]
MSTLEWFDTHAHLNYEYPVSRDEYVRLADEQGVKTILTVGADPADFPSLEEIAHQFDHVFFSVGVHPHESSKYNDQVESDILRLAKDPKCLAIGEIGLDYYYDHSPQDIQARVFERQLELAVRLQKPVIIHTRDAEQNTLAILREYVAKTSLKNRPGVIHCFSGTAPFAQACLEMGFFISFSGIVTFKKAEDLRTIASTVPLDRILLETDAPYLAPVPFRGKTNLSSYLPETARVIANARAIPLETLSKHTVSNGKRLFGI